MFVVIMGDLSRDSVEDKRQVYSLLDSLKQKYADLTIVSGACERGVGSFIRERCIENKKNPEFGFIELSVKIWRRFGQEKEGWIYSTCRNPGLVAIGEEFHIFPSSNMRVGHIADLIEMIKAKNLSLELHYAHNRKTTFSSVQTKQSMPSENLKTELE